MLQHPEEKLGKWVKCPVCGYCKKRIDDGKEATRVQEK